jgi:hypothetical protein
MVHFLNLGGLAFDAEGDLLANDYKLGLAYTFELPNPRPSSFPEAGSDIGVAINDRVNHWFSADEFDRNAAEYSYPDGKLIGKVHIGGGPDGIAIDP